MSETCKLREMNGDGRRRCDGEACVYWRALSHLGTDEHSGCALQYFELLGNDGVVAWLLSVKQRVEGTAAEG